MNLNFNKELAIGYNSNSQIARVLTESWVKINSYCPSCGEKPLSDFENNRPVADFYCIKCSEEFELKSKSGKFSSTITDGAYDSMLKRITSDTNPNFFFLTYNTAVGIVILADAVTYLGRLKSVVSFTIPERISGAPEGPGVF
jgi:type II restriction enzyme